METRIKSTPPRSEQRMSLEEPEREANVTGGRGGSASCIRAKPTGNELATGDTQCRGGGPEDRQHMSRATTHGPNHKKGHRRNALALASTSVAVSAAYDAVCCLSTSHVGRFSSVFVGPISAVGLHAKAMFPCHGEPGREGETNKERKNTGHNGGIPGGEGWPETQPPASSPYSCYFSFPCPLFLRALFDEPGDLLVAKAKKKDINTKKR